MRRLFAILSAVSLLLGAATVVLWVRSHVGGDEWNLSADGADPFWWASSEAGQLLVIRQSQAGDGPAEWTGFAFAGVTYTDARTLMNVGVPYWALAVALAVLPVWWVVRARRRRRLNRPGRCPACGYDLRATPGRCPECGAVPARSNEPV